MGFIRHLREILDINMDVSRLIILECLDLFFRTVLLDVGHFNGTKAGYTMAAQTSVETGAGN